MWSGHGTAGLCRAIVPVSPASSRSVSAEDISQAGSSNNPIAEYLKIYHKGAQSVISSRDLEAAFHIRGPDLRRLINSLRGDGIPICSSDSGYYYAGTEEELQRTIRQLRSRIKKIAHAERGLTKALEQSTDSGQISLPLEGGDTA